MTTARDVFAMLDELVQLTTLDEESNQSFKVRAYENAKRALEAYDGDIVELSAKELEQIKGVGKATATKVRELIDTGSVTKLVELRAAYPLEFVELSKIPGVGPKTLKLMRAELGVENLGDLRAAIESENLRTLPGLGETSEAKIAKAIERLGLTGKDRRTPVGDAMPIAQRLVDDLTGLAEVDDVRFCGSLRRMAETIGDIDITVASDDPAAVTEFVVDHPLVSEVILSGDTKTSFLTSRGLQVDVRVVAPGQFGAAILYFTGSKAHNIELRQRAIERGMLLSEYGVFDASDEEVAADDRPVVAAASEHEIYAALDLTFIPPPMREGTGEVAAAATGDIDVVDVCDMRGDLHYHTDRSGDGRSTVREMVQAGVDAGYEYLALTEHAEGLAMQGVTARDLLDHREHVADVQAEFPDIHVMWGCELNIGAKGDLDYDAEFRAMFDYTVASIHSHFDQPSAAQTERLVRAIADPSVDSIGHLTGRFIGRRPPIEMDVDVVIEAFAHFDVALEINGGLQRLDAGADIVRKAVARGVKIVINSDSHHTSELHRMEYGVLTAQRAWVPADLVINTWERARFLDWVATHRQG